MERKLAIIIISFGLTLTLGCSFGHNDILNGEASVGSVDGLPENPLLLTALTTGTWPEKGTMFTLYGNGIAAQQIFKQESHYPAGTVLYNVIWKQKADPYWFGARIPAQVLSIECVSISATGKMDYKLYKGTPLRLVPASTDTKRLLQIFSIRPVASP